MRVSLAIKSKRPVRKVSVLGGYSGAGEEYFGQDSQLDAVKLGMVKQLEGQQEQLTQLCKMVKVLASKLNDLYEQAFAEHRQQIAALSVQIAERILRQKLESDDYKLAPIIEDALEVAGNREDVKIRLNPQDLEQWQQLHSEDLSSEYSGVKFVGDPRLGRAECVLESPKGVIESVIQDQLSKVNEALKRAQ